MRDLFLRAACAIALCGLCSCYTVNMRNLSGPPAMMGPGTSASVGHFDETRHAHFVILGLINVGSPNVSDVLNEQVKTLGGSSVSNLQLTTTHTFVDGLISVITAGIYNPVTVDIAGDVVK